MIRSGDPTLSDLIREALGDPLGRPITSLDDLDELLADHPYTPKVLARSVNYRYVMERDDRGEPVETLDWWFVDEPEPAE